MSIQRPAASGGVREREVCVRGMEEERDGGGQRAHSIASCQFPPMVTVALAQKKEAPKKNKMQEMMKITISCSAESVGATWMENQQHALN